MFYVLPHKKNKADDKVSLCLKRLKRATDDQHAEQPTSQAADNIEQEKVKSLFEGDVELNGLAAADLKRTAYSIQKRKCRISTQVWTLPNEVFRI